ncbi:telomeric repeat-binding factor 2-interacting protein 1, partial [Rhineura floridana]|uniref:telomeric repeat-binding factor 2-interacting protein 1 n=1 Tax=Rhineura floridana TaxID=261503 RepID=UPI002AC84CDC
GAARPPRPRGSSRRASPSCRPCGSFLCRGKQKRRHFRVSDGASTADATPSSGPRPGAPLTAPARTGASPARPWSEPASASERVQSALPAGPAPLRPAGADPRPAVATAGGPEVAPCSRQAMGDRYLKRLRGREHLCLPGQSPKRRAPDLAPAGRVAAVQSKEAADVPQRENERQKVEGSKAARSIFQMANKEFEDNEGDSESSSPAEDVSLEHTELRTSEEAASPNPIIGVIEFVSGGDPAVPKSQLPAEEQRPLAPSAAEVAMAAEDIKHFMEEFDTDLATVTQAFLKNSGEVAAVACCLRTGQCPGGCPLWSRQDDVHLLKREDDLRSTLVAKYGAENVNKREAFRKS